MQSTEGRLGLGLGLGLGLVRVRIRVRFRFRVSDPRWIASNAHQFAIEFLEPAIAIARCDVIY